MSGRLISPALESYLDRNIAVLDHGFIRVVDYMGDDGAIVQAARVASDNGTKTPREDRGLIRYLMRHWHTSPFEMCELKVHVKLPIFVARQWLRHRTASVNEYSARYSVLEKEFYIPDAKDVARQSTTNSQGRGEVLPAADAQKIAERLGQEASASYALYDNLLKWIESDAGSGEGAGLSRELARIALPVSVYTQFYWKVNLHNLLNFVRLRADPHAQYEIREYAKALQKIVADWVPVTYEAFRDYRLESVLFSRLEMAALRGLLRGENISHGDVGMSANEWAEFQGRLSTGAVGE
ncbi:MAG: FAD-dependent thymidylate synthase [Fimbriimonadaceae bacterium]